jgi:paraquat-inducible protein B
MTNPLSRSAKSIYSHWYLWLFPVIAGFICVWLAKSYYDQRGPNIRILFDDGSSIQAGKTKVRYRGVTIGSVEKVVLTEDGKDVAAVVTLQKENENFAVAGSKFWVVTPKVSFQGISGLETLIEGTYIAVTPGNPNGEFKDEFKGKLNSESSESLEDTVPYFLDMPNADSMNDGDSVFYRGLKVGSVSKVMLAKNSQSVLVQINIQNRYTKLIRTNTIFWQKRAVQAKLGLFNSELKISSMDALLHGGIDLWVPDPPGPIAKHSMHFALLGNPPEGWDKWNPQL